MSNGYDDLDAIQFKGKYTALESGLAMERDEDWEGYQVQRRYVPHRPEPPREIVVYHSIPKPKPKPEVGGPLLVGINSDTNKPLHLRMEHRSGYCFVPAVQASVMIERLKKMGMRRIATGYWVKDEGRVRSVQFYECRYPFIKLCHVKTTLHHE